ncbi:hypothetical protein D3C87_1917730 [compost metagenome]
MDDPILHHELNLRRVRQQREILEGIAIHQNDVGQVARFQLAEFVGPLHDLAAELSCSEQGLLGRHADVVDKVLEIAGIGAVRHPCKAIVAARKDADSALVHFAQRG